MTSLWIAALLCATQAVKLCYLHTPDLRQGSNGCPFIIKCDDFIPPWKRCHPVKYIKNIKKCPSQWFTTTVGQQKALGVFCAGYGLNSNQGVPIANTITMEKSGSASSRVHDDLAFARFSPWPHTSGACSFTCTIASISLTWTVHSHLYRMKTFTSPYLALNWVDSVKV
jgi:hypothetical protein